MDKINLDIPAIKECQQNRYPLLFIDKIVDTIPGKEANSVKCFSYNEWFFPAHFEDDPSVPGFILVESMVQTFIMTFLTLEEHKGKKTNFISINNVKFKKMVVPGDMLKINAKLLSFKRGIAKGSVEGSVDGDLVCKAEFIVCLPDVLSNLKPKN
jgi:3-hydroxyacyl-[acyl-carrier-protein] dehydratase